MHSFDTDFLSDIVKFAHSNVDLAYDYLSKRGVSEDQIDEFDLGFVPNINFDLVGAGPDFDRFLKFTLGLKRLCGTVVIPITDFAGSIVGIHTRSITAKEYSIFVTSRGKWSPFFIGAKQAVEHIWAKNKANIVEGPFDFFPIQRHAKNTLCSLGAQVADTQVEGLARVCSEVHCVFDADEGGTSGYSELEPRATKRGLYCYNDSIVGVPGCKAPGAVWEYGGDYLIKKKIAHLL